jgi:transcription elongation factor S-II
LLIILHKLYDYTMQIEDPERFRQNVCSKLSAILPEDEHYPENLEKGVYNFAIKEATQRKIVKKWDNPLFVQLYTDRLRSVFYNLKSPQLIEQLKNKEITPQSIAFMTHQEFRPDHWSALLEKKMKRDATKYVDNTQASTDMFTCKKCRSKRCTYYELQTRSADEPATIFVTCLDCGKHWKS